MIEIMHNIFSGNDYDYYSIMTHERWAILHCCKHPFHCDFVGYRGSLPAAHPNYALCQKENEMALNLVDMDVFSEKYLDFNKKMFEKAFSFLDEYRAMGYKLLIHCNQGESRGPTLGLLYSARLGKYGYNDFSTSVIEFKKIYPGYNPKKNIFVTVERLWDDFVVKT